MIKSHSLITISCSIDVSLEQLECDCICIWESEDIMEFCGSISDKLFLVNTQGSAYTNNILRNYMYNKYRRK